MAKKLTLNDFSPQLQSLLRAMANVFCDGNVDAVLDKINANSENFEALKEEARRRESEDHRAQVELKFRKHQNADPEKQQAKKNNPGPGEK